MKILHVVCALSAGGVADAIRCIVSEESALGHDVTLAFVGQFNSEVSKQVKTIGYKKSCFQFCYFSWEMLTCLHRIMRGMDVVHVHSNWTFPVWWSAGLAILQKKQLVMSSHGCFDPVKLRHSAWKKKMAGWIDRWMLRRANVIHSASHVEETWVKTFIGESGKRKKQRWVIIPLGINMPRLDGLRIQKTSRTGKCVLYLGRLHPLKGLDLLLEAWAKLNESRNFAHWKLIIAGPDEQNTKQRLQTMIEKSGIEGVELNDGVFDDAKWQLICDSDLFVLPSRTENFGIVVGEALVCSVPVVMTDVGPWKTEMATYFGAETSNVPIQFIETSVSGIVEGLSKMMALEDETRTAMGRNGQAWIHKEFQWERVVERMIEAYVAESVCV